MESLCQWKILAAFLEWKIPWTVLFENSAIFFHNFCCNLSFVRFFFPTLSFSLFSLTCSLFSSLFSFLFLPFYFHSLIPLIIVCSSLSTTKTMVNITHASFILLSQVRESEKFSEQFPMHSENVNEYFLWVCQSSYGSCSKIFKVMI